MKKKYVAPCVAPKRSNLFSAFFIGGGLILIMGGVGTIEVDRFTLGLPILLIGILIMYMGANRLSRR